MSAQHYLKCPCEHCGEPIEFPAEGIGLTVDCPHCRGKTTLSDPRHTPENDTPGSPVHASPAPPNPIPHNSLNTGSSSSVPDPETPAEDELPTHPTRAGLMLRWLLLALVAAGGAVGAFVWFGNRPSQPADAPAADVHPDTPIAAPADSAASRPAVSKPASSTVPKSVEDLKVGPITLEKAKGSSLIHAVGSLRNDSPHQRFDVHLELDLTDATGTKVGVAKDYRSMLEPREEWHFRALVLDGKAVTARVARIREDE